MPLSIEERGILDKQIDDAIQNADSVVERFRHIKNMFHFKEENDAVLCSCVYTILIFFAE
jgi:hypothetical protein